MTGTAQRNRALGAYGERLAARHLQSQGMILLERNWRCPEGELDLVLRDGGDLVACEVKTRSGLGFGAPQEAVGAAKLGRLRRLAERYVADHGLCPDGIRIDLVAVLAGRADAAGTPRLEHVRGLL